MSGDICGATTADGSPCQHPAGDNGSCWIDSHNPDGSGTSVGRDTKLTLERQESIAAMIESGHSVRAAARANGVHHHSILNWIARGEEQQEGIYADFFDRITRAKGEGERSYVDAIMEIAKQTDDPYMLMSMLKQRYPESWGDADLPGDNEVTINLEREVVSADQ